MTLATAKSARPRGTFLHHVRTVKIPLRFLGRDFGAVDLASIMVGVLVIGIIAGVIAATVFAVIPWSQDNAAKQTLSAVSTAESVARVQTGQFSPSIPALVAAGYLSHGATASAADSSSPSVDLIDGSHEPSLATAALITGDGNGSHPTPPPSPGASFAPPAIPSTAPASVSTSSDGSCYIAASLSAAGTVFWITSDSTVVHQLAADADAPTTSCSAPFPAIASVQQPAASGGSIPPNPCNGSAQTTVNGGGTFVASTYASPVVLTTPIVQSKTNVVCTGQPLDGTISGMTVSVSVPISIVGAVTPTLIDTRTPVQDRDANIVPFADTASDWQLTQIATVGSSRVFTFTDTQPINSSATAFLGSAFVFGFQLQFDTTAAPPTLGTAGPITYTVGAASPVIEGATTTTYNTTVTTP